MKERSISMPDNTTKIRTAFNQFDQIIIELSKVSNTQQLEEVRDNLQHLIEELSICFVKESIDYYLKNLEDEPLYEKIRHLNKDLVAEWINRSRSYVYNAIRHKNFSNKEIQIITGMIENENDTF